MTAYCTPDDVDLGSLELPRGVVVQRVIEQQADDIDAVVGKFYRLPLELDPNDPSHIPYVLILNKLNRYLAIGNIIMRAAGATQDDNINSYALYHLNQAKDVLKQIERGLIQFPDQEPVATDPGEFAGPYITNKDAFSRVEGFYDQGPIPVFLRPNHAVSSWPL